MTLIALDTLFFVAHFFGFMGSPPALLLLLTVLALL